ncbi:hypothetical protein CIB84_017658, partial [Bambusicola thoracicus]
TLRCHLPRMADWVRLYRNESTNYMKQKDKVQRMAKFSLNGIKKEHAVSYQCRYKGLKPPGTSQKSDPVELLVTDHSYPPPSISLSPEEHVDMGTNVTIQCWSKNYGVDFLLHKDGHSAPIQHQDPDGGTNATFTLFRVTPADSGTYGCSYRIEGCCLLFSPLGDNVTLEVIPRPAPPGEERRSHGNLVVAVVRVCAAALVFGLGLYFVLDARSLWRRRDDSPGGEDR